MLRNRASGSIGFGVYPDPLLFTNKRDFPNTILASPVDGAAISLAHMLLYRLYEWNIICVVGDTGFAPSAAAVPKLKQSLTQAAVSLKQEKHFMLIDSSAKNFTVQLDSFLEFVRVSARVIQIVAHTDIVRKILVSYIFEE
ncbi:hypothetical protein RvY_06788 [Ramazzottius varieornatus]|uniref:Uncharacterized protein n=1 Tax=Ramazzottius varieornatus TaxID=947166 RepID=A0A1D1V8F9_RAMVA|nr:hypothetical protein RvY_06788 [Ramazzottius varieornatus]